MLRQQARDVAAQRLRRGVMGQGATQPREIPQAYRDWPSFIQDRTQGLTAMQPTARQPGETREDWLRRAPSEAPIEDMVGGVAGTVRAPLVVARRFPNGVVKYGGPGDVHSALMTEQEYWGGPLDPGLLTLGGDRQGNVEAAPPASGL
jgi:hypothetical protein